MTCDLCRFKCTDVAKHPHSFSERGRFVHYVHNSKRCEIINPFFSQGRCNVIVRSCSQFEVWSGSPSAASPTPSTSSPPSVLLFGFAGSKKHQLQKHSKLYNELGYHTLYCILPLQYLFHYDVHRIRCHRNQKSTLLKICPGTVPIGCWMQPHGTKWRG